LEQFTYIQAGSTSLYEILLIILVVVLIFNGLLRNKILRNYQNSSNPSPTKPTSPQKVTKPKSIEGEYIDFEIVEEK